MPLHMDVMYAHELKTSSSTAWNDPVSVRKKSEFTQWERRPNHLKPNHGLIMIPKQ
jgi:hypothetical protein